MSEQTIRADREAWTKIRQMVGGRRISDSKRTILISNMLEDSKINLTKKLKPEATDSYNDRLIKKMLKGFL